MTAPATAIATLTMNPAIDVAYAVEKIVPQHKIRTTHEYANPGGGGINVARVFVRLGGNARAIYLSGGPIGIALDGLIDRHQLVRTRVPIAGTTRIAVTMLEAQSGQEYRVTPEGPELSEPEWRAALAACEAAECRHFVASGSLPRGVPADFYARVARIMAQRGVAMVLDSSGPALKAAIEAGGIALAKPSRSELEFLSGGPLSTRADVVAAARALVDAGKVQRLAVTLGHEGAILVEPGRVIDCPALPVEAKSTVGAGDSFLAAMVHGLATGMDAAAAFRRGMAAGTAAVLHPGTDLAHPDDIARLERQIAAAAG